VLIGGGTMDVELPEYLPLEEAARAYKIDPEVLKNLVGRGKIRAVKVGRGLAVAMADLATREYLWEQVKHLDGNPISMSEACRKYPEINFASLSRWIAKRYIRVLDDSGKARGRGHKRLLNEADVAYTALLLRIRGKRPGSKLFPPDLIPTYPK